MSNSDPTESEWATRRRTALKLTGGLLLGSASAGSAVAWGSKRETNSYTVTQAGNTYGVQPLSGDVPVEKLYDYRLPSGYTAVGVTGNTGPFYQSAGTKDLQAESTSIAFLYDGPDGLSLVVVHDKGGGDGGAATWTISDVPTDAKWLVQDDLYLEADTGEKSSHNYDQWATDGSEHTIDWTWGNTGTDGGVLGYLARPFSLTITPAFNQAAALYGQHYEGDVTDWQFLSGSTDSPDRIPLALDQPVVVECSSTQQQGGTQTTTSHQKTTTHTHQETETKTEEQTTRTETETKTETRTEKPTETKTETETQTEEPTKTKTETPTEEPTETKTEEPTKTKTETSTEEPTETPKKHEYGDIEDEIDQKRRELDKRQKEMEKEMEERQAEMRKEMEERRKQMHERMNEQSQSQSASQSQSQSQSGYGNEQSQSQSASQSQSQSQE